MRALRILVAAAATAMALVGSSGTVSGEGFVEKTVEEIGENDAPFCDADGNEIRYPVIPGQTVEQLDRSFTDQRGLLHVNTITIFDEVEYFLEDATPQRQYVSGRIIMNVVLDGDTIVRGHMIGAGGFVVRWNPDGSMQLIHGEVGC